MPSSPKIPKETILQHALEMLIQNGYASINIKALAKRIGCSTQPISWHFGNMENFRNALTEYALDYANKKMLSASEGMSAFSNVGIGYIDIAFDEPNLFRYLYMSGESGYYAGGFDIFTSFGSGEAFFSSAGAAGLVSSAFLIILITGFCSSVGIVSITGASISGMETTAGSSAFGCGTSDFFCGTAFLGIGLPAGVDFV